MNDGLDAEVWQELERKLAGTVHALRHLNSVLTWWEMSTDPHGFTPGAISTRLIQAGHPIKPEGTSYS